MAFEAGPSETDCRGVEVGRSLDRWIAVALFVAGRMAAADEPNLQTIHSQPSFVLASDQVELAVTRVGGHMAPVTFHRLSDRPVQPYYISPWQDEPAQPVP